MDSETDSKKQEEKSWGWDYASTGIERNDMVI